MDLKTQFIVGVVVATVSLYVACGYEYMQRPSQSPRAFDIESVCR